MPKPGSLSPDIVTIPAAHQDLYGKTVGEMIGEDVKIDSNGSVSGTFHKVTGYTGFNESVIEEQSGYYFPFTLVKSGTNMSFKKNGETSKDSIAWEANNVFRVTKTDRFEVQVDGEKVVEFTFENATFEE